MVCRQDPRDRQSDVERTMEHVWQLTETQAHMRKHRQEMT